MSRKRDTSNKRSKIRAIKAKSAEIKTIKDKSEIEKSDLNVQTRSRFGQKSMIKASSKVSNKQVVKLMNPNESTYGNYEAKGFSTSIYKKGQQLQNQRDAVQPEVSNKELEICKQEKQDKQQAAHSTYYLSQKGFRVLEKVGSGNYAKVYRVINPDNKELAVKIIDLNKTSQNYRVKFLPRELDILSRLHHRNIAKIYEIIQLPKLIYIFMEYTPNGTVADFLRVYKAIPENFCQVMFHRIVDALYYLHNANIAHRDLKLENILIDKHGQPKLTDFSYSLICKSDKSNKIALSLTFCGSLPYTAPEILQETPYDPKVSDVWSLGVCLYVMLNDGLPFKFDDIHFMLKCQLARNWKFKNRVVNKLSDEVKDLVKLMLEPDVRLRIDAYTILQHPWIKSS